MRPFRAIFDLPWWTGLPILLLGSIMVPHGGIVGYIFGLIISLFGCWIFSKLLSMDGEDKDIGGSAICGLLFFLSMTIPYRFEFTNEWLAILNSLSPTILYATRSGLGLFFGFLMFARGFRK